MLINSSRWRWLKERYVAIKVNASLRQSRKNTSLSELDALKIISETNCHHKGWRFARGVLDSFTLESSPGKNHLSLVLEPLQEPLWIYQRRFVDGVIPSDIIKLMIQMILHGLDYIHSECHIIHTGLSLIFIL